MSCQDRVTSVPRHSTQRRENSQNAVRHSAVQRIPQVLLRDFLTRRKGFYKISFQILQERCTVEQRVAFKMKKKTAIIQIYCSQRTDFIVDQAGLCMEKTEGIGIDLYSGLQKRSEKALRHPVGKLFIRNTGHKNTHINASLRYSYKGVNNFTD